MEVGQYFQCPFWLLDGWRRLTADEETTQWGLYEFFPQLSAKLGNRVYMSQLFSPGYQLITQNILAFQLLES